MTDFETLRERHASQYQALLPEHLDRLNWSADRLRIERERRLRSMVAIAKERSPWYRDRLAHVDPERLTERDLSSIPPMTKDDLMQNFDDIGTDRRLSRATVEAHLEQSGEYLFDEYRVVASGGSSGTRGVFVYDWNGWLTLLLTFYRWRALVQSGDVQLGAMPVRAMVAASKSSHVSYGLARTLGAVQGATLIPATLPLREIVAQLNELRPAMLLGYPSMIASLAHEADAGRLAISPRLITTLAEPLLPEMRSTIERAWGARVLNYYGCSEGASAGACGMGPGMHLNEDVCIFELVDDKGRPVSGRQRAAKLYITPLFNAAQPLIRYELSDELSVIEEQCACGSGLRRVHDIEGRSDDVFTYANGVVVHPQLFRSRLGRERHVFEYRVRQTRDGAAIELIAHGDVDVAALCRSLEGELALIGLHAPAVSVELIDAFERQSTGKLKRFIPREAR